MTEKNLPERRIRAGDADRDRVLAVLQEGYESGRLDLVEMRERQEQVLEVRFLDELPGLVSDLPEGRGLDRQPAAPMAQSHPYPVDQPVETGLSVSIMSGRSFVAEPGTRGLRNFALWGGNKYDLRRALGPGRSITLTLHAVMAGSDITVPPGVRVIDRSVAIMAGNEIPAEAQGDGSNGTLILEGFLMWAGNEVKVAPLL